jgi:hypothetical protein
MSSASGIVYVNGRDLATFGVITARLEGPLDGLSATYQTTKAGNRDGDLLLNPTPQTEKRTLLLLATFEATSNAALSAMLRRLKGFLGRGLLEIRSGHDLTVAYYGRLTRPPVRVLDPQLVTRYAEIQFEFTCFDPYPQDLLGGVVQITATPTPIPIGHAIVLGDLWVWGPTTNSVIRVRRADGTVEQSLAIATNLTSGEVLRYRNLDGIVELQTSPGFWETAYTYLPDTYDFPFHLDPQWGNPDQGVYPSLAVSGLSGIGEAEFRYKVAHP